MDCAEDVAIWHDAPPLCAESRDKAHLKWVNVSKESEEPIWVYAQGTLNTLAGDAVSAVQVCTEMTL